MNLKDKMLPLRGEVILRVLDLDGLCLQRFEDKNVITYTAPLILMDLLTQKLVDAGPGLVVDAVHPFDAARGFPGPGNISVIEEADRNAIRYMRVGTGGNPGAANPAHRSDTDLQNVAFADAQAVTKISAISYPSNASIRFVGLFGAAKANAVNPINEVSLWTRGSAYDEDPAVTAEERMFARQIHPNIAKTAAIQLEYTWTIFFT